jgi:hypothetical protein
MLIVESQAAARLLAVRQNMIFLPRGEALELAGMLAKKNLCVVGTGLESRRSSAVVLERPTSHDLSEALRSMGLNEQKAYKYARSCGRSVTILSRLIASATAPEPAWAADKRLIPALLAGSWTVGNPDDLNILQTLAGEQTYDGYEDIIRGFLTVKDAPLEREGQVWNVRAPVDAFGWLGPLIGKQDLTRLEQVCRVIFSEHDPALELPAEERPYAGLSGKKLKHSNWLRDGLASTLLLIAVFHEESRLTALPNPRAFVESLIASLPGLKLDHRLIASLDGELPVLMEAAPRPLFDALEHLLEGDGSGIRPIFSDTDPVFSQSPHTGLLWAMELAAWDPEQLPRAAMVLARLARIDPGGKLSNRPINSLTEIFVPWHPNTNAKLAQRLAVLDQLIAKEREIGWQLALKLLPGSHDFSHTTMKPRYREAGASEREVLTQGLVWETYRQVITRALDLVGSDVERWLSLIPKLDRFDPASRDRALGLLVSVAPQLNEPDGAKLWASLRDLVNRHRAFQDAPWAMKAEQIEKLEIVARRFEPSDMLSKVAWLFNDYHPRLPDPEMRADYRAIDKTREKVISDLYANGGYQAVLSLAVKVKYPRFVAFAAAGVIDDPSIFETLIDETLGKTESLDEFAVVLSSRALFKFEDEWMKRISARVSAKKESIQEEAKLLLAWPDEPATWSFAATLAPEIDNAYWVNKHVGVIEKGKDVVEFAVRKYLSVGRGMAAIEAISWALEIVSSELMLEALDKAVDELNAPNARHNNMLVYEIERVFDALGQRHDVPPLEIARREYKYLPLLEVHLMDSKGRSLVLHRIMAEDPESFVLIICDVFKPASGEPREPTEEARRRASVGYRLLDSFHVIPGEKNGDIDAETLRTWVHTVQDQAKQKDRDNIADEFIGHLLAYAPGGSDGFWPHVVIRDLLEELKSDQIETGILIERSNMRGVVTKEMYEGGAQERTLAERARASARATAKWPRTAALWLKLAESLEFDAKREDERARQDEMWYE